MSKENQNTEQKVKEMYEKNRELIIKLVEEKKLPEPRKLTRKERKQLDAAKVNIFKIEPTDQRTYFSIKEDLADWIMDTIYPDFQGFDELDNNICLWFGEYIFGLSYKNDLAAKN